MKPKKSLESELFNRMAGKNNMINVSLVSVLSLFYMFKKWSIFDLKRRYFDENMMKKFNGKHVGMLSLAILNFLERIAILHHNINNN